MAQPTIQTSFASGEWAPKLRSRVDVQKYHSGAALLRNFYVDYSGGGASTRPGTRFIAQVGANGARLVPFQPSSNLSYVLEFGQNYIRFYSNGAQIMSGGVPYQIASPYNANDLFPNQVTGNPGIKFVQDVTSLIICHPNYAPTILTINSATDWTLATISFGPTINAPSPSATSNLGAGTWDYAYLVTALDQNNQESGPSVPATLATLVLLNTTAATNTITWSAVPGATSYNVYKAAPVENAAIASGAQFGFIGNVTGLTFQDSSPGFAPDFSQTPPIPQNPFLGSSVLSLTLTGNATYTAVPSVVIAAPSSGLQATGYASLAASAATIASGSVISIATGDPTGQTMFLPNNVILLITSATFSGGSDWTVTGVSVVNAGSITSGSAPATLSPFGTTSSGGDYFATGSYNMTWDIGTLNLVQGGFGYTSAPSVTISGGATATSTISTNAGGNPGVPGFLQERLWLAAQAKAIQTINMSQPGSFFNFNISNPVQDDDAITATIVSEELNDIRWLIPVPTGMIAGTGRGAWLINGGGGISTMNPITPTNVTAQPQAFNGSNDLKPLKINFDVLYGTNKGSYFRDLTYNLYAQIFTGADISVLANHLFFGFNFLDWCWAEEPFKTVWVVRNDGLMLSLGFVKEQDLIGWAHHDTNGQFLSCCSVIETVNGNTVDAVYVIVKRAINGSIVQYVERFADRYFYYGYEDSWCVDCALQTAPDFNYNGSGTVLTITGSNVVGGSVTGTIVNGSRGWNLGDFVRVSGGVIKINADSNGASFTGNIVRPIQGANPYTGLIWPTDNFQYWTTVSTVSGLTHLEGQTVVGVADGVAIGPLTVSGGGSVTLPSPASKVTLGLAFLPQLQTLPLDLGEPTVQGKRKKITALTLRVADTLGLQVGKTFAGVVTMKDFQLGAVPTTSTGPAVVADLVNGDGRTIIDQEWDEAGSYCIQQNLPYPATILGAMPEVTVGDTAR